MTPAQLQAFRARLGWSQMRLAQELEVTRNTVTRWEMGLHPIPEMAVKLLALLNSPRRKRTAI